MTAEMIFDLHSAEGLRGLHQDIAPAGDGVDAVALFLQGAHGLPYRGAGDPQHFGDGLAGQGRRLLPQQRQYFMFCHKCLTEK